MHYTPDICNPEEGFNKILTAASKFNADRFLYAIEYKNWDERKMELLSCEVRTYRERLETEYNNLKEFAKVFNKEFATLNNQCYSSAIVLLHQIRSGISETKRLFMRFCPKASRRKTIHTMIDQPKSAYDYSRISSDTYDFSLFMLEEYPPCVSSLFDEMQKFFFVLVRCMQLCNQVLKEEKKIKGDNKYCKYLLDQFRKKVLSDIYDVYKLFSRNSKELTDENPAIASRNMYDNDEAWASVGFHNFTKTEVKMLVIKQLIDDEEGSDLTRKERLLFGDDEKRVHRIRQIIRHFDELIPDNCKSKKFPARYIQMFFQHIGLPEKSEKEAVKYFFEVYTSSSTHKYEEVTYEAVNGWKQTVLKDKDGSYKAFAEDLKKRFYDFPTLQMAANF